MTTITKFASLGKAAVAEVHTVDWDEFLAHLARDPGCGYAGKYKHPGWSSAEFDPPSRANENVQWVHALVLDYDKNPSWDALVTCWAMSYGLVYTTKSHTAECARLRVVLPLSRPVTRDEYAKVWDWGRRTSINVGLVVDPQTKDESRFWYEPSTPSGGAWRSELLGGAFVDPDAILALSFIDEAPKRFASGTLQPLSSNENRARGYLRKVPGATSGDGGHHRTWLAIQHAMIGFDLDVDTTRRLIDEEYNPRCEPPWSERELEHKLKDVNEKSKLTRGYHLTSGAPVTSSQAAACATPLLDDKVNVDWGSLIRKTKDGKPRKGLENVYVIVRHHPRYMGRWTFNQMTNAPWLDGAPASEVDAQDIRRFIDVTLGFTPTLSDVQSMAISAALDRPFHPLQAHLRSLEWDGVERLRTMAQDHLMTSNVSHNVSLYHWMISAVARAFNPGLKVDMALVLTGPQGNFKSTFLRVLGGAWFSDTAIDLADKDRFLAVASGWIIELGEIEYLLRGRHSGALKTFLTSSVDNYRAPYAKAIEAHPRSSVFSATTNHDAILDDETGSRRFAVIPVQFKIDIPELERVRDQLWAEAVAHYGSGAKWWNDHDQDVAQALSNNEYDAASKDPWFELIDAAINKLIAPSVLTTNGVLEMLGIEPGKRDKWSEIRVGKVLKCLGWQHNRTGSGAQRRYQYTRTNK